MKVLMVSPPIGGIDVYVSALSQELSKLGAEVGIAGSKEQESTYDIKRKRWKAIEEVKFLASKIAGRLPYQKYDILAFHFGKNDIEQYIPYILQNHRLGLKNTVYFVHFLTWNLFSDYLGSIETQTDVESGIFNFFGHYVFFSSFAKQYMEKKANKRLSGIVSFLPETHSQEKLTKEDKIKLESKFIHPEVKKRGLPIVVLPGFAANYKDHKILLESLEEVNIPFSFLFAGQSWGKRLGFAQRYIGKVFTYAIDEYLSPKEYKFLVERSLFGIFPYRQPGKREIFQGSGALPNFIFNGKATIVFDSASLPEYVDNSGIVVTDPSPRRLARVIEKLFNPSFRKHLEGNANARKDLFALKRHALDCFQFFSSI